MAHNLELQPGVSEVTPPLRVTLGLLVSRLHQVAVISLDLLVRFCFRLFSFLLLGCRLASLFRVMGLLASPSHTERTAPLFSPLAQASFPHHLMVAVSPLLQLPKWIVEAAQQIGDPILLGVAEQRVRESAPCEPALARNHPCPRTCVTHRWGKCVYRFANLYDLSEQRGYTILS